MRKLLLIGLMLGVCGVSQAAEIRISCTAPMKRADDTAFPATGAIFSYGTTSGVRPTTRDQATAPDCTVRIAGLTAGKTYYVSAKLYTANKAEFSAESAEIAVVAKEPGGTKGLAPVIKEIPVE
jgi:hypothetical protein